MLAMPQMRPASSDIDPKDPTQKTVTYEGSSSPRELLESCVIQAQAALKGLEATAGVLEDEEMDAETAMRMSMAEAKAKANEKRAVALADENEQLKTFWSVMWLLTSRQLTCSERILQSANNIDRSLVSTKGQAFVDRMRASLPRLPDVGVEVEGVKTEDKNDEEVIKICESRTFDDQV